MGGGRGAFGKAARSQTQSLGPDLARPHELVEHARGCHRDAGCRMPHGPQWHVPHGRYRRSRVRC